MTYLIGIGAYAAWVAASYFVVWFIGPGGYYALGLNKDKGEEV